MESWVNIARLVKAKTNEGGLSVQAAEGLPFLLEEGMEVAFVPPVLRKPRRACVVSVQDAGRGRCIVHFDAIGNRDDAEALEGCFCLVREASLPEGWDAPYGAGLVGFTLEDRTLGCVGSIVGVAENPAHPLLEVALADYGVGAADGAAQDAALVPLVEDFIVSIDEERSRILVDLPAGLLDL